MDFGSIFDIFHDLSTAVIAAIVLLSMAVSFFLFKYFDKDFWNQDSYSD